MQINWFIVIAQIINFFILVWLLKRFLYKPILKAIDEREKKIVSQLEEAEAKKAEAIKEQAEFLQKNAVFDQEKLALMNQAVAESNEVRQKLLEEVRNEAGALRSNLKNALKELQEDLSREITRKAQEEVFAIVRKTLSDLASLSLEEQSVHIFIKRLNDLNDQEKKQFIEAFRSDSNPILLQSTYALPEKLQEEIKNAVSEVLGIKPQFQFKTTPELISGIELISNGYKLAWSIAEYLRSFQNSISETMRVKSETESDNQPDA